MPIPSHVLVDTNALWEIGHPDFQKIIQLSREGKFKLVVPHIVWEERRTQILEDEQKAVRALQAAYDKVHRRNPASMFGQLILPPLALWSLEQMTEASKAHMVELSRANNFEVVPLDPSHAARAWERYFDVNIPFKREQIRENRRKDIPDSWIFEAAIDLYRQEDGLVALCGDEKLQHCFESIGISVFKKPADLVRLLEVEGNDDLPSSALPGTGQPTAARKDDSALAELLESAQSASLSADRTVLGIVGYLTTVPKGELESMMETLGMGAPIVRNAAERLVLSGLIQDTGHAYIPKNRQACDLAAREVEPLMIKLVTS